MLLSRFEKWVMRSPLRRWGLRRVEAPRVLAEVSLPPDPAVVEIGCGYGDGALLISHYLRPGMLAAVDIDPAMVAAAGGATAKPPRWAGGIDTTPIEFVCGDAARLPFADRTFDAAVLFGILHHVPPWREAIAEVWRVLRPGGLFTFEEALIADRWYRFNARFGHVPFAEEELRGALTAAGFEVHRFENPWYLPTVFVRAVKPSGM